MSVNSLLRLVFESQANRALHEEESRARSGHQLIDQSIQRIRSGIVGIDVGAQRRRFLRQRE